MRQEYQYFDEETAVLEKFGIEWGYAIGRPSAFGAGVERLKIPTTGMTYTIKEMRYAYRAALRDARRPDRLRTCYLRYRREGADKLAESIAYLQMIGETNITVLR